MSYMRSNKLSARVHLGDYGTCTECFQQKITGNDAHSTAHIMKFSVNKSLSKNFSTFTKEIVNGKLQFLCSAGRPAVFRVLNFLVKIFHKTVTGTEVLSKLIC